MKLEKFTRRINERNSEKRSKYGWFSRNFTYESFLGGIIQSRELRIEVL